jgi:hypothetical protein
LGVARRQPDEIAWRSQKKFSKCGVNWAKVR